MNAERYTLRSMRAEGDGSVSGSVLTYCTCAAGSVLNELTLVINDGGLSLVSKSNILYIFAHIFHCFSAGTMI